MAGGWILYERYSDSETAWRGMEVAKSFYPQTQMRIVSPFDDVSGS